MKAKNTVGKFKNEAAEQKFRQAEQALWDQAGTPTPELKQVSTAFGLTTAFHWPGAGPPIVMLHGMTDTSRRWAPYVSALEGLNLYAIDLMGEAGRSRQEVPFSSADDYATWLNEALVGFGLEPAHLVGYSLGGYPALDLAVRFPERVRSLVLLEAVGLAKLKLAKFMLWAISTGVASMTPKPIRSWLARRLRQPVAADRADSRLLLDAQRSHPPTLPPLQPLSDEALRSISAPVTVVVGQKSQAFDTSALVERVKGLIPNVSIEVIADAGHALAATHTRECIEILTTVVSSDSN